MREALKIIVKGRVQGVGFRPFVYSLSQKYHFNGTVQNNLDCVVIHAEGDRMQLDQMVRDLKMSPPKLAKISGIIVRRVQWSDYKKFAIVESQSKGRSVPWIPADAAVCEQCLKEMNDPQNRRFQYPFINCTQCGPRYTIINHLPYDRPNTTMGRFEMCQGCRAEYEDPSNRRHHAEPVCCPTCGPTVTLLNKNGESLAENRPAIARAADLLERGHVIAIKGIGGYHLVCDAFQKSAVGQIRLRKHRPQRPLALMVKSLAAAKKFCHISNREEEIMTSPEMPIVILQRERAGILPENISPGLSTFGMMLPYTPLHHLLFANHALECLVMTSANSSGFPMPYKDGCFEHLRTMCDYILTHDREIAHPIDDSVVQWDGERVRFLRRARGYVTEPFKTNAAVDQIIALGGQQKNTFAAGRQNQIVLSPHIGDLGSEEMLHTYEEQLRYYKTWIGIEEKCLAVDRHPLYATAAVAGRSDGKVLAVQHHHAHHVSCMEDNGLKEPCLGIILDGTGYGDDGHIWGFEFLYADANAFERLAHLRYTPLPGGEKAVKEPWRNAAGMLIHDWPREGKELAIQLFPEKIKEINILEHMVSQGINAPLAGTCGRLFDAISAILGICSESTYEGEAATKLADYMHQGEFKRSDATLYPFRLSTAGSNPLEIDLSPMVRQIIQDRLAGRSITEIIQSFHRTLVACCTTVVLKLVKDRPAFNRSVVLSGGSFQNSYLSGEIRKCLQNEGFNVFTHRKVPCHDGGLALGQIIIASRSFEKPISESW